MPGFNRGPERRQKAEHYKCAGSNTESSGKHQNTLPITEHTNEDMPTSLICSVCVCFLCSGPHMESIIPDSASPLFLLTFLMKDKTATTFFRDAEGHTRRSARNKMNRNTNKMKTEKKRAMYQTKTSIRWPPETTTVEQQRGAGTGQTTGARAVWCGPAAGSLPGHDECL